MAYLDQAPADPLLTDYDREHLVDYLRLLDASEEDAGWREVAHVVFGIDPAADPERARLMHESHPERAHWFSREGYRDLLRSG